MADSYAHVYPSAIFLIYFADFVKGNFSSVLEHLFKDGFLKTGDFGNEFHSA